jgi:hypothetical protein
LVQALTSESKYKKDFSQEASDHIATLAAAKANQDKEICDLISEVKNERERVFIGEIEELVNHNSQLTSNLQTTLKEISEHYKSEMNNYIQSAPQHMSYSFETSDTRDRNCNRMFGICPEELYIQSEPQCMSYSSQVSEVRDRNCVMMFGIRPEESSPAHDYKQQYILNDSILLCVLSNKGF